MSIMWNEGKCNLQALDHRNWYSPANRADFCHNFAPCWNFKLHERCAAALCIVILQTSKRHSTIAWGVTVFPVALSVCL